MIIDSHAHISHSRFDQGYRFVSVEDDVVEVVVGEREDVLERAARAGITAMVEPAIDLESNDRLLEFADAHPGLVYPAVGLHPKRVDELPWEDRGRLDGLADRPGVVAIGEIGLDYSRMADGPDADLQRKYFAYQLELAYRKGLPVILHIRGADEDSILLMQEFRGRLPRGVVHCYKGDWKTASKYLDLGFSFGIGGALVDRGYVSEDLREAVRRIPLEKIVVETDSPFVLPQCPDHYTLKDNKKIRNTPLILP